MAKFLITQRYGYQVPFTNTKVIEAADEDEAIEIADESDVDDGTWTNEQDTSGPSDSWGDGFEVTEQESR